MIPETHIIGWRENAPWSSDYMVEQDLLICRTLVAIFSDEFLASQLAFRGGTALHKLYLLPQQRYSEDIDLVQINPGPIKPIIFRLGEVLSYMPDKVVKQKRYNNTLLFRVESEMLPVVQIRLKVEINCFEHFSVLGLKRIPFSVNSPWFTGSCDITTYELNELLGTKMRALYQRRKGRDLFDLWYALTQAEVDEDSILKCYDKYMSFVVEHAPTYKEFVLNMEEKMNEEDFLTDMEMLLRPDTKFDPQEAYQIVKSRLIDRLPGDRWE